MIKCWTVVKGPFEAYHSLSIFARARLVIFVFCFPTYQVKSCLLFVALSCNLC